MTWEDAPECKTHSHRYWGIVLISEVQDLLPRSISQVDSICKKPCRSHANRCVCGLYPPVGAFDEEFGVKDTFNTEDDTVRASQTNCDAVTEFVSTCPLASSRFEREWNPFWGKLLPNSPRRFHCFLGIFDLSEVQLWAVE